MQAISREALPLPATPKGVTTYGQRNGLLFMLKGPRLKTVSCRTVGFPEYGMANASNFTRGFTPASNPERGNNIRATKWAFIYVKGPRLKTVSYRSMVQRTMSVQMHSILPGDQQRMPLLAIITLINEKLKRNDWVVSTARSRSADNKSNLIQHCSSREWHTP